ncbi:6860_t:CDS:2 [Paraglomus brasilianum]|uniref:6860_t:CDS:1 n=1 Tax=Paraglomus brasilianum TaxID=144538 RepID=A0A9N9GHK5_9GLOM|nr:6860_t:CDS:2 [Paraglomus brasilianum]
MELNATADFKTFLSKYSSTQNWSSDCDETAKSNDNHSVVSKADTSWRNTKPRPLRRRSVAATSNAKVSVQRGRNARHEKAVRNSPVTEYRTLIDVIDYDLDVLFCGINPGIKSSLAGHHFAGPNNHFYPCLYESGLTRGERVTFKDDIRLACDFGFGITNVVKRVSRTSSHLTPKEYADGIPSVVEKVKQYRPKYLCFVGKVVFESFSRWWFQQHGKASKNWKPTFGFQSDMKLSWDNCDGETKIFAVPSTSGRVSHYQKDDKVGFFRDLKNLLNDDPYVLFTEETKLS